MRLHAAIVPVSRPDPLPSGCDPNHVEWNQDEGKYYCLLCWKYVAEGRIGSKQHQLRALLPESYLTPKLDSLGEAADEGTEQD